MKSINQNQKTLTPKTPSCHSSGTPFTTPFSHKMTTFDEPRQITGYAASPVKQALTAHYETSRNAPSTVKR